MRKIIIWLGLIMIGILAIPVAVFVFLISIIWSVTEKLAMRFEGKEEDRFA